MDLQITSLDHCLYLRDIILTSFGPRIPTLRGISNLSIMYAPWMRFNDGGCISGIELSLIPFTNSLLQSSSPMPSGFTQSIEVVEIAEHHLQLYMALQIQRKLKQTNLRVDWHFILWCIAKSGTQEWNQNNYHGFPKALLESPCSVLLFVAPYVAELVQSGTCYALFCGHHWSCALRQESQDWSLLARSRV